MPKGGFWSPDEGAKFIQLHSVAWAGGLHYEVAYGGRALDPELAFYPTRCHFEDLYPVQLASGGIKFHWPVWFPLAHRPLVATFGLTGLYLVSLVSGWMVALLAGHLSRAWHPRLAPWVIVVVGLGTPIAFFSLTFWEHTLSAALALSALALLASPRWGRARTAWIALPLLIATAALRIETGLFAVALAGAWAISAARAHDVSMRARWGALSTARRRLVAVAALAGVVVVTSLLVAGLPERHRWMLGELPAYAGKALRKVPYLADMLAAALVHVAGNQAPPVPEALAYAVLAAVALLAIAPLLWSRRAEAAVLILALAIVLELSLYLIARPEPYISLHGLLPVAPVLVLAPYAVLPAWRGRRYPQVLILAAAAGYAALTLAVIFVFVFSSDGVMPTGLQWGNRYFFILYPLGVVLAAAGVYEYRRSRRGRGLKALVTAAAAALALCGVLLEARGLWTLVESRRLVTAWQTALRGAPLVLTDVWWLPAAMGPLFIAQPLQCVRREADIPNWLPLAQAGGVDEFAFASFHPFQVPAGGAGTALIPFDEHLVDGLRITRVRIARASAGAEAAANGAWASGP